MDYKNLTSPCGRDCFNCQFYLASSDEELRKKLVSKSGLKSENVVCLGCRNEKGECRILRNFGFTGKCKIYACFENKNADFCHECQDFPCNLLHPLAHGADRFPHNLKVFNLCRIKKIGLESWARSESQKSSERYYRDNLKTCM